MMKIQKGYSMVVLVIAITVIIILASSAISILQVSREKTAITNFIFDLTTVEEEVQDFYISTGALPIKKLEKIDMSELNASSKGILSQLYVYDNENYYYIDLSQLGTISVKDSERGYIVNEGSLKVYVAEGISYNARENESPNTYYTLTSDLVNGLDAYKPQNEEILVLGNPVTWSNKAELRVVIPNRSVDVSSWRDWTFKWDFGPKTEAELEAIPVPEGGTSSDPRIFEYGDILTVKSNGIYSIYVKDPQNNVTVINVNVTKIDDISPTYKFINNGAETQIQAIDNETGIKTIRYKTLKNYNNNVLTANETSADDLEGRTNLDYYLLDGVGKDLIYDLEAEINYYNTEKRTIEGALNEEIDRFNKWKIETNMTLLTPEEIQDETNKHENLTLELENQLNILYNKYPYLYDIYGKNENSRLVVYIEDYSGNATVVGEMDLVSTIMLAKSYNISIDALVNP